MKFYIYLSERPLWAPTRSNRHRKLTGPIVFKAPRDFLTRTRHPALLPFEYISRLEGRVPEETLDQLREAKNLIQETGTEALKELSYRELQKVAKKLLLKAGSPHDILLKEVQGLWGGDSSK